MPLSFVFCFAPEMKIKYARIILCRIVYIYFALCEKCLFSRRIFSQSLFVRFRIDRILYTTSTCRTEFFYRPLFVQCRTFWPSSNGVHENTKFESVRNVLKVFTFLMFPKPFVPRNANKISHVGAPEYVDIHRASVIRSPVNRQTGFSGFNVSPFRVESNSPKTSKSIPRIFILPIRPDRMFWISDGFRSAPTDTLL